jgi:acyl-CoA synthetase (NDP forming)
MARRGSSTAATSHAVLAVRDSVEVPVFVARFGGAHLAPRALERYAEAGVPVLDAPDRTMQAIGALCRASALMRSARGEQAWTSA